MGFVLGQREAAGRLLSELAGEPVQIRIDPPAVSEESGSDEAAGGRRRAVSQEQKDKAMRLPLVRKLADLFDGSLVDVQMEPDAGGGDEPVGS